MAIDRIPEFVWDPCCGTGNLLVAAREKYPGAHFSGLDRDSNAVEMANSRLDGSGISRPVKDSLRYNEDARFDLIVMNPPFVEGNGIQKPDQEFYREKFEIYRGKDWGKIHLAALFTELGWKCLKRNGVAAIILPMPLLRNKRYSQFRKFLGELDGERAVLKLPPSAFPKLAVETVILRLKKTGYRSEMCWYECGAENNIVTTSNNSSFSILSSENEIFRKMERHAIPMEEIADSWDGINPGRADFRKMILGRRVSNFFVPLAADEDVRHPLAQPQEFNEVIHRRTLLGKDFEAFQIRDGNSALYLRYEGIMARQQEFFVKGTAWSAQLRDSSRYDVVEKVITRQTADTLIAAIDRERRFPLNSVHSHLLKGGAREWNYRLLCLVLNSELLRGYYRYLSGETGKVFPQVHLSRLRKLPLPVLANSEVRGELLAIQPKSSARKFDELIRKLYRL